MTLFPHSDYEQLPPPGAESAPPRATSDDASTAELAGRLGEQVSRLVRAELALAQAQAKQRAKRIGLGVGMFGAGGMFAFFGACCGVTAAILGFCNVVQPWLAAIIVGACLFVLAGLVVMPGWKGINERRPPIPADSIDSVKADIAAVREAIGR